MLGRAKYVWTLACLDFGFFTLIGRNIPKPKLSSPVGMYVKWYKAEEQFSMLKSNILG